MKKLSEHNELMRGLYSNPPPDVAGVACDQCGTEMVYSDNAILASYPGQRRVHCPECERTGTKVV